MFDLAEGEESVLVAPWKAVVVPNAGATGSPERYRCGSLGSWLRLTGSQDHYGRLRELRSR